MFWTGLDQGRALRLLSKFTRQVAFTGLGKTVSAALRLKSMVRFIASLLICNALLSLQPVALAEDAPAVRDGQRDFDFELGSWKIHLKRRLKPLTGSERLG